MAKSDGDERTVIMSGNGEEMVAKAGKGGELSVKTGDKVVRSGEGKTPAEVNKIRVRYELNGRNIDVFVKRGKRLLDHLREDRGLLSVKEGCGTGECGACTVLLDGKAVCSCLLLVPQVSGKSIVTVEGLGAEKLHPIQRSFVEEGAVQCGFCTPGMILAAKAVIDEDPEPSEAFVRSGISGNLCRCTGYSKIIKAILAAAERMRGGDGRG